MKIIPASMHEFDIAFDFIKKLWATNQYDQETVRNLYSSILNNPHDFAFFVIDKDEIMGFCHGTFFNTFWHAGLSCYISSLITKESVRGQGYGLFLMDHAKALAIERQCKAIFLDSGLAREPAHRFYEKYGFTKCAFCYQLPLCQ